MKLENCKVYTQDDLIKNGSKELLIRYKLTPESARLARELESLLRKYGTKEKLKKAIKEDSSICSNEVKKYLDTKTYEYKSPSYNRYFYTNFNGEYLTNVDRTMGSYSLEQRLEDNGHKVDCENIIHIYKNGFDYQIDKNYNVNKKLANGNVYTQDDVIKYGDMYLLSKYKFTRQTASFASDLEVLIQKHSEFNITEKFFGKNDNSTMPISNRYFYSDTNVCYLESVDRNHGIHLKQRLKSSGNELCSKGIIHIYKNGFDYQIDEKYNVNKVKQVKQQKQTKQVEQQKQTKQVKQQKQTKQVKSKLVSGTVYSQNDLIKYASKDLLSKYKLTPQSAKLATEYEILLEKHTSKANLNNLMNVQKNLGTAKLRECILNNTRVPIYNKYLYINTNDDVVKQKLITEDNEFLENIDRNSGDKALKQRLKAKNNKLVDGIIHIYKDNFDYQIDKNYKVKKVKKQ